MNNENELNKLINICHSNIKNSEQCLNYLKNDRKIKKSSVLDWKIGYFPRNIDTLKKHISYEFLKEKKIIDYSGNSQFSEIFYLVFPIYTEYNEPIGIGGRTLMDDNEREFSNISKYKNSSFKKSEVVYGMNLAVKHILAENNVFIAEGYFDCISLHQNGIKNSVAICGTAFTKNHLLKLLKYTDTLTFLLDRDSAGLTSAKKIYSKYINKGFKLRFCMIPDGYKDIDEYFRSGKTVQQFQKDLEIYIPEW